ncbi:MAG: MFS transporter [Clostridia bacterium]|nr:MFS transporter [Clostridia bacterium]
MEKQRRALPDYKWIIITVCALMVMTVLGFCSSANSIYIRPITEALGITRASYSVTSSVRYVTTAVVNLFFGVLIYRLGAKLLIMLGFSSLVISTLIYSLADSIPVFCVGSVFLGLGLSFTTTTMVGAVVNRWWGEKKGTVMGFILASNGIGAAVARVILTPIIQSDTFGYRNAYRLVSVILSAVAVMMLILFRNDPKGQPRVKIERKRRIATEADRAAFRKPYFYVALVCVFLTGLTLQGVSGIADPLLIDNGLDSAFVTAVMSVHSIALSGAKLSTGFIYDRFGVRTASVVCYVAAIVAMLSLAYSGAGVLGQTLAVIYAVISSVALPLETVMLPIFARELFGEHSFNSALGIFASVNTAGYAVGGPLANLIFDVFGTYNPWIFASIIIIVAVSVAMHVIITVAKRDAATKETEPYGTV